VPDDEPMERFSWLSLPIIIGVTFYIAFPTAVLFLASRMHSTGELVITLLLLGLFAVISTALLNRMPVAGYVSRELPNIPRLTGLVVEGSEFSHYEKYWPALWQRAVAEEDRILKEAESKLVSLVLDASFVNSDAHHVNRLQKRALAFYFPMLSLCGSISIAAQNRSVAREIADWFGVEAMRTQRVAVGMAAAGLAAWIVGSLVRVVIRRREVTRLATVLRAERDENDVELRVAVGEAVRRALNDEVAKDGRFTISATAPRLVELSASQIRSSRAREYVQEFIEGHDSSAIGLAGFRGAGKSTIMRAVKGDGVLIDAPVEYEAADFSRHLLLKVAHEIAGENAQARERRRRYRIVKSRAMGFFATFVAGMIILVLATVGPGWLQQLGALQAAGLIAMLYGAAGFCYAVPTSIDRAYRRFDPSLKQRALELIDELQWEVERGSITKNVAKILNFAELHDEDSVKRKQRAMTRIDYASRLRDLLETYSSQLEEPRFVICVDELDKLPTPEKLIEAINNLKELFHIQGVHFVVSVSIDALKAFERRGLPSRDAFDSAFDTIIDVGRLTIGESVDVITSRATVFHPALAYYCHAWAGGLPRDLLRTARRFVELNRGKHDLKFVDLITRFVTEELTLLFDGLLGTRSAEVDDVLWEMRVALGTATQPGVVRERVANVRQLMKPDEPALNAAITRFAVGLYILETAQLFQPGSPAHQEWPDKEQRGWFELLARVIASTASHERLQDLILDECAQRLPAPV
jgi:hypothetical protein